METDAPTPPFQLNQKLDLQLLASAYRGSRRVRIANLLATAGADRLYRHLDGEVRWRTFIVANQRQMATDPAAGSITPDEEREMIEHAGRATHNGFASVLEADALHRDGEAADDARDTLLDSIHLFLNSPDLLRICRVVTGIAELNHVATRATRLRCGHFATFHDATESADPTGKRRVNFSLNVTPHWQPEWGGLLCFRGEQDCIEGLQPSFNTLDLFRFPQGHWISPVAQFATGSRYAISGFICVD